MNRRLTQAFNWLAAITGVVWFGALFLVHFITSNEMSDYRQGVRNLWRME